MSYQPRIPRRPQGALRAILRAPIMIYNGHMGWLLGHRFLMLTHRGRTSGRIYRTVLEVARYDPQTRESVVASGFANTDWYRNLQAHPALEVMTGRLRYTPEQRFLNEEERYAVLIEYERRHKALARVGFRLMYGFDGTDAGRRALAEALPMVAFRPSRDRQGARLRP